MSRKVLRYITNRAWMAVRKSVLRRDAYACVRCGYQSDGHDLHVHHIDQALEGRRLHAMSNLEVLCVDCHLMEHGRSPRRRDDVVDEAFVLAMRRLLEGTAEASQGGCFTPSGASGDSDE